MDMWEGGEEYKFLDPPCKITSEVEGETTSVRIKVRNADGVEWWKTIEIPAGKTVTMNLSAPFDITLI